MPRTSGSENHFVNPGMSDMSDTQKDPSGALLTPSGVPGSLSIKTSLLPARGCGGRYNLHTKHSSHRQHIAGESQFEAVCGACLRLACLLQRRVTIPLVVRPCPLGWLSDPGMHKHTVAASVSPS